MDHPATQCVHSGTETIPGKGINTPTYASTAFGYLDQTMTYPRYFNAPNQENLQRKLAALEQGEAALLFSSGMAAISNTLISLLSPGDHAIFQEDLYGGTIHLALNDLDRLGIKVTFAPATPEGLTQALTPTTKLIFLESPSNPLLRLTDLQAISEWARTRNLLTVMDNTFASPINQQPLTLGIDLVLHSGTKYLGGHSDVVFGCVVGSRDHCERMRASALQWGGSLNAQMCSLVERSIKTLAVRVERQNANALEIAKMLQDHPAVAHVFYPGLADHPDHALAKRQMMGFGGMLSFETATGDAGNAAFQHRLQLIQPVVSLGGVESTIVAPALASHASIPVAQREAMGVSDRLLRLSVGIEHVDDLKGDLLQALENK